MIAPSIASVANPPEIKEHRLADVGMRYLCLRPTNWTGERAVTVIHGISRNYAEHAELFAAACLATNTALIVPRFSKRGYRGYQRLRRGRRGLTAAEALQAVLSDAQQQLGGNTTTGLRLFGFSGGAQFVHRFSLVHPDLVGRQVVTAAGYYTLPQRTTPYPYGLKSSRQHNLDARGFLVPTRVLVGDRDTVRDEDLRTNPDLDRIQGRHRLDRARRYVLAVRAFAACCGHSPSCSIQLLKNSDHELSTCDGNGGLVDKTMRFLVPDAFVAGDGEQR